ncbi:MAG TPA: GNAT family protein [Streptosporangiaceae bacterium]
MHVSDGPLRLRPVIEDDLEMFRRFTVEPGLIGLDWAGFRDAQQPARRFAADGYLGTDNSRLIVEVTDPERTGPDRAVAGFVSFSAGLYSGAGGYWEIGIVLLPEWRGRGVGWRAQALLCDYLFAHTPAQRIQAATHAENVAEQKALEKAGFTLEGVIRAAEFRAGQWRDGCLYSRLRDDPPPAPGPVSG